MFEKPEDLSGLDLDALRALSAEALAEAREIMEADDAELTDEQILRVEELMAASADIDTEAAVRETAEAERAEKIAALRAKTIEPEEEPVEDSAVEAEEPTEDAEESVEDAEADNKKEVVVASAPAPRRTVAIAQKRAPQPEAPAVRDMRDIAYATNGTLGVEINTGVNFQDAGRMLDRRLNSFSKASYEAASKRSQHMREQHTLMAIRREIPEDLVIVAGASRDQAAEVMARAADPARLPGGALTAAGWCAPSEISYDICLTASRDGLYSLPEIGISRGGIQFPTSPSFAEFYAAIGFHFTEQNAIDGAYAPGATPGAPNVVGDKPCYELPCPTWTDYRLEGDGVCLTADLLTQRGYPEGLAWALEAALIAHDHKVSLGKLNKVIAGSTPVTMTAGTVGTTAPLLAAIEIQAESIRYAGVLARSTVLEGVFPFWIRGAIRQDLSVRLGVDLLSVTDAQIDAWFRQRGIVPQYVYDWQPLPADAITWPATVQFLIYEAGAWVSGVDDIITLDTIYDSTQLGQNKYTALFTEEAWLVAPRCGDSRVVTVPVYSDGSTHAGVLLQNTLAPTPAP
jgi:hypothetical protein